MIIISPDSDERLYAINKYLSGIDLKLDHQDVLFFDNESKLGVEQVKKIREYISIRPYSSNKKGVVVQNSGKLTIDAQNALLKTLEELPGYAFFILGAERLGDLIETVQSRCQIINLEAGGKRQEARFFQDIEKLAGLSIQERFEYVEKLEDKEQFLKELVFYFQVKIKENFEYYDYVKIILKAIEWKNQNVNIRAILEYLMMEMPGA